MIYAIEDLKTKLDLGRDSSMKQSSLDKWYSADFSIYILLTVFLTMYSFTNLYKNQYVFFLIFFREI
jgi:hypothetical protein